MELEKQQYLDTFLHIVKGSRSKNEFLKNVQDFDNKFTQAYQGPNYQKKASFQSFPSVQQIEPPQKPKNPFINQAEQNVKRSFSPSRSNNFIQQQPQYYTPSNNMLANNQNKMNMQPSRSEQQFFKPPQASKTFHAGFGPKDYQRQTFTTQQYPQYPPKGPNFAWQTAGDGFNQQQAQYSPQSHFEQQMKQNYNEMRKNFANFGINQQQQQQPKYQNSNIDLSINSHQNFNPINYGNDILPQNQFLAAFSREDENMAKYYKGPLPYPKQQQQNPTPRSYMMDKRLNPFSNQ